MTKLSLNRINALSFFTAAVLLYGCGKDELKTGYVAKVNDAYLTQKELAEMTDTMIADRFYRDEIVRGWINRELLYQEALKQGILDGAEYSRILVNSKKELAAALVISSFLENTEVNFDDDDLDEYYSKNTDEFRLLNDGYFVNEIEFMNEEKAVIFRNFAVEKNWAYALRELENDSLIAYEKSGNFLYEYEINPSELSYILKELNPGELSVILNKGDSSFFMVQLLGSYPEGTIPPFEILKGEVERRYLMKKKKEALDHYIKMLYSNNEINVR